MLSLILLLLVGICNANGQYKSDRISRLIPDDPLLMDRAPHLQTAQAFIWPLPQQYTISDTLAVNIDAKNFHFTQVGSASTVITTAFSRYVDICFPHADPDGSADDTMATMSGLAVAIDDPSDGTLDYGVDESYTLVIQASGEATLTAPTVWGALRGLETFSQIVVLNSTMRYYQAFVATIRDTPRFSHRGILIDTSRHFQSVASIKRVLDGMSYNKFNVLHWHIVDGNSFPYESLAFPKLWDASYTTYERYMQSDVKDVINYAWNLGIRVIPEFDVPGHAQSWCVGYPEICPSRSCNSPLNVAADETWDLLDGFIAEAANLFPDSYLHLGGDEVNPACWDKTPSIAQWMEVNGINASQALQYFDERVVDIGAENNKLVIQWEHLGGSNSSLDPTKAIVQIWQSANQLPDVVASGFRAIFSPYPTWYLDQLTHTWQDRYVLEPFQYISDLTQQKLVLGGEACMWGESVDASDIEQTIWPTASAVAERLWSLRTVNSTREAAPRMEYFRCLMNERGVAAAPSNNAQSRSAPPRPGSCYAQRR